MSDESKVPPTVVCLVGSTRFKDAYLAAQRRETLAGRIYLSVGLLGHEEGIDMDGPVKAMLDELHLRKIDLADEVLVLDCPVTRCRGCGRWHHESRGLHSCGCLSRDLVPEPYIGDSTRREIEYATATGKRVRYLSQEAAS